MTTIQTRSPDPEDDDLGKLAAAAVKFARRHRMTIVPAVPSSDYGRSVILTGHELDLSGFLKLARKLGDGALYLDAYCFTEDPDTGEAEDIPAFLAGRTEHLADLRVAFASAGHGMIHFWEAGACHEAPLVDGDDVPDELQNMPDMLDDEERERLAGALADDIVVDPEFRAATSANKWRRARLLVPEGTDRDIRCDGVRLAIERARVLAERNYQAVKSHLTALAEEFLASPEWQESASSAGRRQAATQFLITRADGFFPPAVIRDELYARAQRLSKNNDRGPQGAK